VTWWDLFLCSRLPVHGDAMDRSATLPQTWSRSSYAHERGVFRARGGVECDFGEFQVLTRFESESHVEVDSISFLALLS
jgi:hypothetical protein